MHLLGGPLQKRDFFGFSWLASWATFIFTILFKFMYWWNFSLSYTKDLKQYKVTSLCFQISCSFVLTFFHDNRGKNVGFFFFPAASSSWRRDVYGFLLFLTTIESGGRSWLERPYKGDKMSLTLVHIQKWLHRGFALLPFFVALVCD